MFDNKMPMNRCTGVVKSDRQLPPPEANEVLKDRLAKWILKRYGDAPGITLERTRESRYSCTITASETDPVYPNNVYWQDYTLFVDDPGTLMQEVVDYGNEYGDFTEENWDDIARLTRWLVDGGKEFECGFGVIRRLEVNNGTDE